jgi:hypothetical protein
LAIPTINQQPTINNHRGRLLDPVGGSLATAVVRLMPHSNGTIDAFEAPATRDGRFRFADVPAGNYMLTVSDMAEGRGWNGVVHDLPVLNDVTDLIQQVRSAGNHK